MRAAPPNNVELCRTGSLLQTPSRQIKPKSSRMYEFDENSGRKLVNFINPFGCYAMNFLDYVPFLPGDL